MTSTTLDQLNELSADERLHLICTIALYLQVKLDGDKQYTLLDALGEHPFFCSERVDKVCQSLNDCDASSLQRTLNLLAGQLGD